MKLDVCISIRKKEYWNSGTLEYWVNKEYFCFSHNIPLFHHSIIPELYSVYSHSIVPGGLELIS